MELPHLKPYQFKPGQSGNPGGRPKDSLKAFARNYLKEMSEKDKREYLAQIQKDMVWRMAEGNPESQIDSKMDASLTIKTIHYGDRDTSQV
jgi:hypothetical protein